MIRLLQIEFHKLWNNRSSKILISAYFIILTFIALIAAIKFDIGPIEFHLADQGIFNFPYIWHFNAYIAIWFKLFLAIVIVSMMANEYSNRTLKQNLIDGLSKKEFILSKFYTVVVFALVSTLFIFIISLILGLIYSDYNEFSIIFSDLEYILAYFIRLVAFFSFCLFLGILIKRSAFALGFLGLWAILEWIMFGLLGWKVVSWETAQQIKNFFPLESMHNLIIEPFSRLGAVKAVANQVGETLKNDHSVHWYSILIAIAWTAIFIYASYRLLKRRDL